MVTVGRDWEETEKKIQLKWLKEINCDTSLSLNQIKNESMDKFAFYPSARES